MNEKELRKDVSIQMLIKPLSMVLSYIYVPIVLKYLGEEKYGIWVTLLSIISWVNYFDIGIGNGVRNKLTECLTKDNTKQAKEIISTGYLAVTVISSVFFLVFSFVFVALDLTSFFKLNLSGENTTVIVLVSVVFICLNFIFSIAKSVSYAMQKSTWVSISGVLVQFANIIIVLILSIWTNASLLAVAIMYGFTAVFGNVILDIVLMIKYPFTRMEISAVKLTELKEITSLGLLFFTMQICSLVLNTTDNLLISRYFGAADVTPYSTVNKLFKIFIQVHNVILTPMWSAYTAAAVQKDYEWMKKNLKKMSSLTLLFSGGAIILIFVFRPIASLWLGRDLHYSNSLIVFTAIYTILTMIANVYNAFLCGVGDVRIPSIFAIVQSVINIPLSLLFAVTMKMGLAGIILGSVISVLIPAIVDPIVTYHWFRIREGKLYER